MHQPNLAGATALVAAPVLPSPGSPSPRRCRTSPPIRWRR